MMVKIEPLQDGGRREFMYRDRAGEPEKEGKATHVEVIEYDAEGRFISSTIAERSPTDREATFPQTTGRRQL